MHNMEKCGRGKGRPQGCSLRSHRRRRLAPLPPPFSPAPMLRHVVYASLLHFGVETAWAKDSIIGGFASSGQRMEIQPLPTIGSGCSDIRSLRSYFGFSDISMLNTPGGSK